MAGRERVWARIGRCRISRMMVQQATWQRGADAFAVDCPTCYPTHMKKTSVYLSDEHVERLRRLAAEEGRSQAEILRDAILTYASKAARPRRFAMDGVACGPGGSIADIPEEELLEGFGED